MALNKTELIITATDQTAGALNSVRSGIGGVQSAVAALGVSLSVGAFTAFVKQSLDAADAMKDMAERTGISIKQLASYKLAAEQSGASIEAVARGIKAFSTFATENSDTLKKLGIETKDTDKAMRQMADIVASMPDDMQRNAVVTKLFGKAGQDLIPMLKLGSAGLQEAADKSAAYAAQMERLAPLADQFNDNMSEIKMSASAAGMSMVNVMAPALAEISKAMAEAAQETGILKALWIGFGGVATALFTDRLLSDTQKLEKRIREINDTLSSSTPNKDLKFSLQQERAAAEMQLASLKKQADAARANADKAKTPEQEAKARIEQLKKEADIQRIVNELMPPAAAGHKAVKVAKDEMAEASKKWSAELDKENETLARQIERERERVATIGLTEEEQAKLTASNYELAAATKEVEAANILSAASHAGPLHSAYVQAAKDIQSQADQLRELASLTLAGAGKTSAVEAARAIKETERETERASERAAETMRREFERTAEYIENRLTDSILDGGKFGMKELEDFAKTIILRPLIQAVTAPIAQSVAGVFGGGGAMSGGAGGFSANPFQSWTGSSMGQGIANAGQWLSSGSTVGPAAPGSIGSLFSGAGQYANWQYGLAGLGGGLLGGAIGGSTGGTLGGIGATVGMAVGGPVGGLIGSVAGGLLGGLFGGGGGPAPHNNPDKNYVGFQLSRAGAIGFSNTRQLADEDTGFNGIGPYGGNGGFTRSGKSRWSDRWALPKETVAAINAAAAQLFAGGAAMAGGMGLDPNIVNSASVSNPYFASVEAALSSLGDAIVTKVIPNIKDFQQANESLGDTASRLVAEYNLTNSIAKMRGQTGAQAFGAGLVGRDQLVQLLGGVGNAGSAIGGYYQNFYSDAEQQTNARGEVSATLKSLGVTGDITTRAQFRALVDAQDLTTESGRKMYASLIAVSGAFASVANAANSATDAMGSDKFKTRADYEFYKTTGVVPAFADGGFHSGGWRVVGERGPELEFTGPSRIVSNQSSNSLVDVSALLKEIAAMRDDMARIGAALARPANKSYQILDKWDTQGVAPERAAL